MGLVPLSVRCAVNEHDAVLHQGLGTDQFIVGGTVNYNKPRFARTTLQASGEVPHVQPQFPHVQQLLVASLHVECVYEAGVNLSVGSGDSQLILLLLVVGFSLVPSLVALVPVVPRYGYCSVLAGKRSIQVARFIHFNRCVLVHCVDVSHFIHFIVHIHLRVPPQ